MPRPRLRSLPRSPLPRLRSLPRPLDRSEQGRRIGHVLADGVGLGTRLARARGYWNLFSGICFKRSLIQIRRRERESAIRDVVMLA
jgi:hypothetical protein